jgi:hypothetical protein
LVTWPEAPLVGAGPVGEHDRVAEELISRREVTAMLFAFADINANVERIVRLLEGDDGEEEASEENA